MSSIRQGKRPDQLEYSERVTSWCLYAASALVVIAFLFGT